MSEKEKIHSFLHCGQCLREKPRGVSPAEHARIQAGLTATGIQVWCNRHRMEVGHFTPDELAALIANGPSCDCCPGGRHRS